MAEGLGRIVARPVWFALEHVRTDGDHHLVGGPTDRGGRSRADRAAVSEHTLLCAGTRRRPRAGGHARRALHWRRRGSREGTAGTWISPRKSLSPIRSVAVTTIDFIRQGTA